jgi:hypothetical protein
MQLIIFIHTLDEWKESFIHNEDECLHSSPCLHLSLLVNIHFAIKFLGFTCMCIGEKTFYHPKFQL